MPPEARARVLDDLARVANGAVSTLAGVKQELDQLVRQRIEKYLTGADLVPREEFEAVQAMAAEARAEQARLGKRLAALEAKLGVKPQAAAKAKAGAKAGAKPKAAPKSAPRAKPKAKPGAKARKKPA